LQDKNQLQVFEFRPQYL